MKQSSNKYIIAWTLLGVIGLAPPSSAEQATPDGPIGVVLAVGDIIECDGKDSKWAPKTAQLIADEVAASWTCTGSAFCFWVISFTNMEQFRISKNVLIKSGKIFLGDALDDPNSQILPVPGKSHEYMNNTNGVGFFTHYSTNNAIKAAREKAQLKKMISKKSVRLFRHFVSRGRRKLASRRT